MNRRTRDIFLGFLFAVLGTGIGLGVVSASDEAASPEVEALHQAGMELQRGKHTDAALVKYQEALKLAPDHVPTLYEIGWSWYVLGRWDEVVATWERVLELEPDHEDAARYLPEARTNLRLSQADPSELSGVGPDDVAPRQGETLRLALGGDTMMGSPLSRSGLPRDGGAGLFDAYRELMNAADITFLNLEGVLLDSGRSSKCSDDSKACYAFRTPVSYVQHLVDAGVDVVSIANNHANDFGESGRSTTRETLTGAGVEWTGVIGHRAVIEHDGTRVGFLGFSTSPGQNDLRRTDAARVLVAELASEVDLVVVSFHGGAEGTRAEHVPGAPETYYGEDRGDVRAFAHAVVDAGADLVVGHGPHVLRGVELYRERLVLYSLGNFVTYGGFGLHGPLGLTVLALVDLHPDGRFAGGRLVPGRQVPPGAPRLDPEAEAIARVRALSEEDFGSSAATISADGTIAGLPASLPSGTPDEGEASPAEAPAGEGSEEEGAEAPDETPDETPAAEGSEDDSAEGASP